MCKAKPAPRCKKHAEEGLDSAQAKYDLAAAETAQAESDLTAAREAGRAEARLVRRVERSQKKQQAMLEKLQLAQLEYDSTPDGQSQIEKLLHSKNISEEDRDSLRARLQTAHAYRVWQNRAAAKLKEIEEKDGIEAALKWAEKESRATMRRVRQIELEMAAKWRAEQAKKFRNLPREEQIMLIIRKASKIYYRLNRYRTLYRAITTDLDKFVSQKAKALASKKLQDAITGVDKATRRPAAA